MTEPRRNTLRSNVIKATADIKYSHLGLERMLVTRDIDVGTVDELSSSDIDDLLFSLKS